MTGGTPCELLLLGVAVIIGLVQIAWSAGAANNQRGVEWGMGPRDEPRPLTGVAGRLNRAVVNFGETFPLFAAAVVAATLAHKLGPLTYWGSIVYVLARALFVVFYAIGAKPWRTLVWAVGFLSVWVVTAALFL
jgi:uncharacterized MAPEG superfamily protein